MRHRSYNKRKQPFKTTCKTLFCLFGAICVLLYGTRYTPLLRDIRRIGKLTTKVKNEIKYQYIRSKCDWAAEWACLFDERIGE